MGTEHREMSGKVFLNYRRSDAEAWADRLFERLIRQFPREDVFMDIDGNIPFGFPWAAWLDAQVAACDLMLVLIGRSWVEEFRARSAPDERDFVRVEIESALARKIPVVPVFLGDAPVPRRADLPATMRPLLDLQAARLQRASFEADAEGLVAGVARSIALARGEAVAWPGRPGAGGDAAARTRADGRIRVDARIVHGVAPGGWFEPGAGRTEWFKDHKAGPEMVVVPAGSFVMGSPGDEPERIGEVPELAYSVVGIEQPRRTVTMPVPFAVGRCAVTVDEFAAFVRATGHETPGKMDKYENDRWEERAGRSWRNPGFAQTGRHPVVGVSWDDATAYAGWLAAATGQSYRLLSEAEWEYVCRAGTTSPFWWGQAITPAEANYGGTYAGGGSKGVWRKATLPADYTGEKFRANPWGLHQVHGNVWEWCEDIWHLSHDGAPADGSPWVQDGDARQRVVRGGSWFNSLSSLRAANRSWHTADVRSDDLGFRLGRSVSSPRTL